MPPTLEVITTQMENLKQNIEATNARNLEALKETERRNITRHNELKELLLDAIACKADKSEVSVLSEKVKEVKDNQSRVAWIVLSSVLIAVLSIVIIKQ